MNSTLQKTIRITSYFALALATFFSFYLVFIGLDFRDSFFYACKFLYADEVDVYIPFTHFVFRCCSWLFGDYMIVYRICNWLFFYLTCLAIYLFVQSLNKGFRSYGLWILSVSIVLMTNINLNVFSGESVSAFFLICSFITLYKATHSSRWWLIPLSISITLCVLSQFPNIVLIPILLMTGWLFCSKRSDYGYLVLSVVASLVVYVMIGSFIYGGLRALWDSLVSALTSSTIQDDGADHSISFLMSEYLHSLKDMVSDIKFLSLICILPLVVFFTSKKVIRYLVTIAFILLQIVFISLRVTIISDVENTFLIEYIYSIFIIVIFSISVIGLIRRDMRLIGYGIIPLCISLCAPAGSDNGLGWLGDSLFAFLPWLFFIGNRLLKTLNRGEVIFLILSLVGLSLCSFISVRNDMHMLGIAFFVGLLIAIWCIPSLKIGRSMLQKEMKGGVESDSIVIGYFNVALIAAVLTIYAENNMSFERVSPKRITCQYKINQLKYIRSSPECCQYVDEVMKEYVDLTRKGEQVIFFGNKSFLFSYLSHSSAVPGTEFTQADIQRNVDALERFIAGKSFTVFLCPENPVHRSYSLEDYPKTIKMLEEHGYVCEPKGLYAIYHPTSGVLE